MEKEKQGLFYGNGLPVDMEGPLQNPLLSFRQSKIDDKVMDYLLSEECFTCSEKELVRKYRFNKCVDIRRIPEHTYYEGYWHQGGKIKESILSMNPREGYDYFKPAAPIKIQAFLQSFRKLNKKWLIDRMAAALPIDGIVGPKLRELFLKNYHFADLACQFHFNDAIPPEYVGWHFDSVNSFLHMAISIHGKRALYSDSFPSSEYNKKDEPKLNVTWQNKGDVYISSPIGFRHAVEYPKCNWENRIIALQCRFLLTSEESLSLSTVECQLEWKHIMEIMNDELSKAELLMPSLIQVQEEEKSLIDV